ncbi:MAG: hypothetical protein AAGD13_03550 [Pseudomonadota bacterium]
MPAPAHPDLDLLATARVHEATGAGRRTFALALAARLQGAVLWVQDRRVPETLYPPGIATFLDPARLILVQPTGALPILQVMEEALRSGAAPLIIGELGEAPDLTASRRLQLAAGTGGARGLCLVPETRLRTNAAETRWRCAPMPGGGAARQHWEILKNKKGRLGQWHVAWNGATGQFAEAPGDLVLA